MKKLLALVLALVMTLSLATVSTNAAFEDAADISYEEAANVLSAVGVFVGDGKNFAPKAALNREQAAKLVAYLALGEDVAEALPAVQMYDDVAASSWAAKYIAYCSDAGIITGDGAGKFYPTAPVDGYAFAKMLLCALGYKAEAEGYVGANWQINVAKDAKENNLNKGGVDLAKNLTREEAAQVMFNAIKAKPVDEYDETGSSVTIGNVVVNQDWGKAKTKSESYYEYQWDATNGALTWTADHDDFGRDANKWVFEGKEISRVADDTPDFVITEKMTSKEVTALLKGYTINDYKINGDTTPGTGAAFENISVAGSDSTLTLAGDTTAAAIYELTADGTLVEIYTDSTMKVDQIVVVAYAHGQVEKVTTDKKTGVVSYKFEGNTETYKHDEDTKLVFDCTLAEDDIITYAVLNGKMYIYPTTKMTGALTSADQDGVYTIAGDTYTVGATTWAADSYGGVAGLALSSDEAEFWLDQYGYIVQAKGISAKSDNYAYVLGVNADSNADFGNLTVAAKVKLLLTDGTVGIYDVKVAKKDSKWYVNNADGAYICAADAAADTADTAIDTLLDGAVVTYKLDGNTAALSLVSGTYGTDKTYVDGMYYNRYDSAPEYIVKNDTKFYYAQGNDAYALMNDKTVYVLYDKVDEEVDGVYVGNNKLGDMEIGYNVATDAVISVSDTGAMTVKYVFAFANYAKDAATVDAFGYIDNSKYTTKLVKDTEVYVYTMTLTDGTTISLTSESGLADSGLYKYDTENEVEDDQYLFANDARVNQGSAKVAGSVLTLNGTATYNLTSDTKVVDVSDDYDEADDACVIFYTDKDKKVIEALFIVDADVLA